MIAIPSGASIYLCTTATDMRKSFDGLSGLIRSEFQREPNDGSLFLFINRRRDRIKILYWEATGFALWYKRLESGTLEMITGPSGGSVVTIDSKLELLTQEIATLQAEDNRQRSLLHEKSTQLYETSTLLEQKISLVLRQANLIEQKDALLGEQSATIRKQEEKLAAQQLEINRLLKLAFGRRSERYLESPQQLQIDFGGGPEVIDAADGLQQAVDEKQLVDEATGAAGDVSGIV